jgi:hypothetical protein
VGAGRSIFARVSGREAAVEWIFLGAIAAASLAVSVATTGKLLENPDFSVFWAAAHTGAAAYDRAVNEHFLVGLAVPQARSFAYPPTFLVLIQPLRLLSYAASYVAWVTLSVLAIANAARLVITRSRFSDYAYPRFALLLLSPGVLQAAIMGQTTLFLAAAIFGGLCVLHRPYVAGLLFGLALCVKPQLGLLLPLGLAAGGHWRVLLVTIAAGLFLCLGSVAVYGPAVWLTWIHALPGFLALNDALLYEKQLLHLPLWAKAVALPIGAFLTWKAFREAGPAEQMLAAVGTVLVVSPHVMWYEPAVLAPAAMALLLKRDWRVVPATIFLAWFGSAIALGILLTTKLDPLRRFWPALGTTTPKA